MISDYSELVTEVSARSGISDVANRAKMFVGMAEKNLSKHLRLSGMETSAILTTDADGNVSLPSDYQEMRSIRVNQRNHDRISLDALLSGQCGYAVQGKVLKSSYKSAPHAIVYYAAIPSLEANNTNWLLEDEPETYLQAVLFQVYTANNELEKAQAASEYVSHLMATANESDNLKRYSGTHINFRGVMP